MQNNKYRLLKMLFRLTYFDVNYIEYTKRNWGVTIYNFQFFRKFSARGYFVAFEAALSRPLHKAEHFNIISLLSYRLRLLYFVIGCKPSHNAIMLSIPR